MCHSDLPEYKEMEPKVLEKITHCEILDIEHAFHSTVIAISAESRLVKSGFPYQESLASLDIHESDWERFSVAITSCVQRTFKDRLTPVLCGVVSGSLLSVGIGPFALIAGVTAAKSCARAIEQDKIQQSLAQFEPLYELLSVWNREYFVSRDLKVRLEVPIDEEEGNIFGQWWTGMKFGEWLRGDGYVASVVVVKEENSSFFWVRGLKKPRLVVSYI